MPELFKQIAGLSQRFLGAMALAIGTNTIAYAQTQPATEDIPRIEVNAGNTLLDKWRVIGPFASGSILELLDRNLAAKGATTGDEAGDAIRYATASAHARQSQAVTADIVDLKMLYAQPYELTVPPSAAYLLSKLVSDQERQVYLMLGSHDGTKIWLNGRLIFEHRATRRIEIYGDAIKINIPAGESTLCIKSVRSGLGWTVAARLAADVDSAAELALQGHAMLASRLLTQAIIPSGKPVVFAPVGIPEDARLSYTLRKLDGAWAQSHDLSGRTAPFPESERLQPGLYSAEISLRGKIYAQPFIVGSSATVAAEAVKDVDALSFDEPGRLNVGALKRRVEFLLRPENVRQDRTLIHALVELSEIVKAARERRDAFKGLPGLHVRTFTSKIDDQIQYYRIFVPRTHNPNEKLPLMVVLPTMGLSRKPFIESVFLAAHSEAERMSVLAEKYGMAVLWCGYRKAVHGDPTEFAHINEAIDAAAREYPIDDNRITLAGSCSAGAMATGLACREPNKFAGIALHNAMFGIKKSTTSAMVRACYANAGFRSWAMNTDTQREFLDSAPIPTLLVNDGAEPGHGDLEISVEFQALAKSRGQPVSLECVPQTVAQHFGAWEHMIAWLSQARRSPVQAANTTNIKTISEVFTQRFAVVSGSGGEKADQNAMQRLQGKFAAEWRTSMLGECRIREEKALNAADRSEGHLVLIGNERTNTLWAELGLKTGVNVETDKVRIGNRSWEGKDLSVQVRVDDPTVSGRSLVFIGGSDLSKVNPATMNLATDGWYQYAIWDPQGKLVDAGTL
jgi:hypothetical protein